MVVMGRIKAAESCGLYLLHNRHLIEGRHTARNDIVIIWHVLGFFDDCVLSLSSLRSGPRDQGDKMHVLAYPPHPHAAVQSPHALHVLGHHPPFSQLLDDHVSTPAASNGLSCYVLYPELRH